jgi:hypothetical protein
MGLAVVTLPWDGYVSAFLCRFYGIEILLRHLKKWAKEVDIKDI